ncbi:hypothetical protein C2845_PM10G11950 [Panicum miliaceum]|uniref:Uncharacterized protein n=1 Tax=Panicum miliaceum TaxID=4540 RepID=A0A3L6PAA3_PANMI|nr:hypothetical protein C2845_PM10G11950 [Panicum miliaceum]
MGRELNLGWLSRFGWWTGQHAGCDMSFLTFHEHGRSPAYLFLLGLLHEWEVELQHLNPNGVLHIVGYFYARALTLKRDPLPAAVGGFGDRNLEQPWFPTFMGARLVKKKSWSWGPPIAEKGWVAFLEAALQKCITEGGLTGARLFYTFYSRRVIPLAKRMTRMWEY